MNIMEKIVEIFTGHLIIKSFFVGSKSDGYIAYLFTDKLNHYKLGREGAYGTDDDYFFGFNKKYVQVTGYLFQDKILMVSDVAEIEDPIENRPNLDENAEE